MAMMLNATADINRYLEMAATAGKGVINPEIFYSKQLLDTIRYDANQYVYFRLADSSPIQNKADKLMLKRWAPLQAHTVPLEEGIPPLSDKGSVEDYTIEAKQYGRYMEFTDKVDFAAVDPIIAHYTREYSLVAMETLDLLARETLFAVAQPFYAGGAANFSELTVASKPSMTDLRLIVLSLKKALVKPRANGRYHVIGSSEFFYDMIDDATVKQYMTINQTTKTMYDNTTLCPMFDMEFYETMLVPTSGEFIDNLVPSKRVYQLDAAEAYKYVTLASTGAYAEDATAGYVKDSRTGADASYIPVKSGTKVYDLSATGYNTAENIALGTEFVEFKAQHVLIIGKDALIRTGLAGQDAAKVYVKEKGSAGVLDPIDQRQSLGFKINSVGFGSARLEAIADYICVPSQVNLL